MKGPCKGLALPGVIQFMFLYRCFDRVEEDLMGAGAARPCEQEQRVIVPSEDPPVPQLHFLSFGYKIFKRSCSSSRIGEQPRLVPRGVVWSQEKG